MPDTLTKRAEREAAGAKDYGRVKHPEFARRVQQAMDANPEIPPPNYGRIVWFVRAFQNKFQVKLTPETARKWIEGISMPYPDNRKHLAEILGVDEGWLVAGGDIAVDRKERRLRDAEVDGAVNLVAGLIQMDGGNPAFPGASARDSDRDGVDLYAVIRGAHYALNITTAIPTGDSQWRVPVPSKRDELMVLAVVRTGPFSFDILEIDEEAIVGHGSFAAGAMALPIQKKGGIYQAGELGLKQVKTFAERL